MYRSTKHYGHEVGLSACFRQWRTDSHCNLLHGYALAFTFTFEAETLDDRNWVVDFGGLEQLKDSLRRTFDHKLIVAGDDPELETLLQLHHRKIANVLMFPDGVGCEKFAKWGYETARGILLQTKHGYFDRVRVVSCEVREHGANSAIYIGP